MSRILPHRAAKDIDKVPERSTPAKPMMEARRAPIAAKPVTTVTAAPVAAAPTNVWPATDTSTPAQISVSTPQPEPGRVTTVPVINSAADEIIAAGQTGQASPPAAAKAQPAANQAQSVPPTSTQPAAATASQATPVQPAQAGLPAKQAVAESAKAAPVVHAMFATPAAESPVGSASWIAQVLAALGGAIGAGAVAWFLIGPVPRPYG